ncbi:MAG: CPXCG motif-containing cysteine-rich protein [Bacteroidetes bacterium]|nr:MAG: CPXCG motif-containing cysteine-rich protein [Bacteroidota bacterium]
MNTATYLCAYCGEPNETEVDPSGGAHQTYTEDCQICCRPNVLHITIDETTGEVFVESEFEG